PGHRKGPESKPSVSKDILNKRKNTPIPIDPPFTLNRATEYYPQHNRDNHTGLGQQQIKKICITSISFMSRNHPSSHPLFLPSSFPNPLKRNEAKKEYQSHHITTSSPPHLLSQKKNVIFRKK
ncbi:hypothetical protein C7212DRAFT_213522, partial [Tuber magnatum]